MKGWRRSQKVSLIFFVDFYSSVLKVHWWEVHCIRMAFVMVHVCRTQKPQYWFLFQFSYPLALPDTQSLTHTHTQTSLFSVCRWPLFNCLCCIVDSIALMLYWFFCTVLFCIEKWASHINHKSLVNSNSVMTVCSMIKIESGRWNAAGGRRPDPGRHWMNPVLSTPDVWFKPISSQ